MVAAVSVIVAMSASLNAFHFWLCWALLGFAGLCWAGLGSAKPCWHILCSPCMAEIDVWDGKLLAFFSEIYGARF